MPARTTKSSSKSAPVKAGAKGTSKLATRNSAKSASKRSATPAKSGTTSAKAPAKKRVPKTSKSSKATARKPAKSDVAPAKGPPKLLEAMTGKASPARAADGDKPVFAYIATLPQPQREIAERVDALAARTLPNLHRAVKWGMAYYGVGDGWCFSSGAFVGHVKVMFINGVTLTPVPPVTPIGMGKSTRGVELASARDIDEVQLAAWMRQITSVPGIGGKRR